MFIQAFNRKIKEYTMKGTRSLIRQRRDPQRLNVFYRHIRHAQPRAVHARHFYWRTRL